jgi:aspartate aminotransferase
MALPAYVEAIGRASIPRNPGWFGYKTNPRAAQEVVARSLRDRVGVDFESEDIFLTNGASTALFIVLSTVLEPGDEVIYQSPPWFFYKSMIAFARGQPVGVSVDRGTRDLDVAGIAESITPRTRAVIVNSPNNPTGKIYPRETLERLSDVLLGASQRHGKRVYLISDECYSRIVFDGRTCPSPTSVYPHTFMLYSYGKVLLTPGQRLGYVAIPPTMPERERIRPALLSSQYSVYGIPDAVHQHPLPEIESLSIDVNRLERRRDRMVQTLGDQGYDVNVPEGAFYLLVRSPLADDHEFTRMLAARDVFVLPGSIVELPGYFRICLTASDEMVQRSLPAFSSAIDAVRAAHPDRVVAAAGPAGNAVVAG